MGGDLFGRFIARSHESPNKVAIYRDNDTISYREVMARVTTLSDELRAMGIKDQDKVAIQIARSPQFVISVFAVMSVGAVFVPLSEDEPAARADAICARIGISALIRLKHDDAIIVEHHVDAVGRLFPSVSAEIAYILHTSGSSGNPKGVAIDRRALANCLSWHVEKFEINASSVVSHLNLTSFDFIIAEVLLPFLVGASMAIPTSSAASDVVGVIGALSKADVTVIQLVPTLLGRLLRGLSTVPDGYCDLRSFRAIGHMICNGEALQDSMRREFYRVFPRAIIHNCYGPTETCVGVTEYLCPPGDIPQPMYIGSPVPNVTLFVCDSELAPTPDGKIGELLIGGIQTGVGYVGDPAETSAKFLDITTSDGPAIVYKTGDLVRLSADGVLEFMGRADTQVKYRGLRLELGEIESLVQRSGLCEEAKAIITHADESNDRQELLLFVTPSTVSVPKLRRYLSANLPNDRQPTGILLLEVMPATDRGKLDRERLISVFLAQNTLRSKSIMGQDDVNSASITPLEILLQAISEVTKGHYLSEDIWPVAGMDSLARMDLSLTLLERGLTFKSHLCESHGVTLQRLSEDLEPLCVP